MKTIDSIISTDKFLKDLSSLTNTYILLTDSKLKPYKNRILKYLEKLKNLNVVEEYEGFIKWHGNAPTIETAYDFYYAINDIPKTFLTIKDIIENPENYSNSELTEAIQFNGLYKNETGKSFIVDNPEENFLTQQITPLINTIIETPPTIDSNEYRELSEKFSKLKREYQDLYTNYHLLEEANNFQKKQTEKNGYSANKIAEFVDIAIPFIKAIAIDVNTLTTKSEAMQGSFRKVIGMLTSVQKNNTQLAKILYAILLDRQLDFNGITVHEGITHRKEIIEDALKVSKELNEYNEANNARYLPKE